ncbi:MAG: hypothetical protein OXU20_22720, partial [Myxococcales bacterium]|nr:hypothetical protein [Myxococcales bacterium]
WGGRYTLQFKDGSEVYSDALVGDTYGGGTDTLRSVWRWRSAYQNDFASRMDWQVRGYGDANHPPVVVFNGQQGAVPVTLATNPADEILLSAEGSSDPDFDALRYRWYVYPEAGTYDDDVPIAEADQPSTSITVPSDASGHTIHVILEVRDDGSPPLTRYRRVVLEVGS